MPDPERKKTWRDKLISLPGIAAAAAFTTAVSWFATQFLGNVRTGIEARDPISVVVRDNPSQIGAFSDQTSDGVIPAEVLTTGSPGSGCTGFRDWLRLNRGVDAGRTKLQLIVQGKVAKPVLLSEMRVKVLEKLPPITGIPVSCPPAGEATSRHIEIDLDANPPRVTYQSGSKTFGFTIQNGETETFNIVAKTAQVHVTWVIELDLVVDGQQRTVEVASPGGPFETTPKSSSASWVWDYQGSWSASFDRPRPGVPEKILVGTPLPALR